MPFSLGVVVKTNRDIRYDTNRLWRRSGGEAMQVHCPEIVTKGVDASGASYALVHGVTFIEFDPGRGQTRDFYTYD